jgi:sugar lactone lactonase YvrE
MKKAVAYLLTAALVLSWAILPGLVGHQSVHAQQAAPELRRLHPEVITAGAPSFTIRLDGRDFAQGADILFDGVALPSPRVTPKGKQILAEVDSSLVAAPGTHTIQARNPDGTASAAATLTVVEQDPDVIIRLPQNSVQEDTGFIFLPEIRGQGFDEDAVVLVWRREAPTEIISSSRAVVEIDEDLTTEPARIPITLVNPGARYSNTEIFFVVPRAPRINFIEPDTVEVGTEDVEVKVHGNFNPNAVVLVNGQPVTIAERREGRLDITIPASLISGPARLILRVEQDGIQSRDQILTVSPVDSPFLFGLAPNRIRIGEGRTVLDVIGANFRGDIEALVDGQEARIRDQGRTRLRVIIPEEIAGVPGAHTLQLKDGDVTTAALTFEVVADVTVSTLAGSRRDGFNQGCVSAEEARMRRPRRLSLAADGLLYFTDQQNHAVRTVNPATGEVCTIAGTGEEGYKDTADAAGDAPVFSFPNGVAVASDGTIFVTENGNSVVRRIRRAGADITVDTFAGTRTPIADPDRQDKFNSTSLGLEGFRSDELLDSAFRLPDDIIIAPDGTIYVADAGNHAIRRIRNGVVETIAGSGVPGFADGVAQVARFDTPTAIVLSDDGRFLYVADTFNSRIRRVDLVNNLVETFAGSGEVGLGDGPAIDASFNQPIGLAIDDDGILYVSEAANNAIRRVDQEGNVSTLAGGGSARLRDGPGVEARFNGPRGLAIDRQRGVLYVADYENFSIREIQLR